MLELVERPSLKITFGIIVLNGEPFIGPCLRSLLPLAHEIIVVEGACPGAARQATEDGHSIDDTVKVIKAIMDQYDDGKVIQFIQRSGFWIEKDEMSRAYAERATGDLLWQVDADEFYHAEDIIGVADFFASNPAAMMMTFSQIQFWGGFSSYADGWYLRQGGNDFRRVFRWAPGSRYASHRPPTVIDAQGNDLASIGQVTAAESRRHGWYLYHYSLVFFRQVLEKARYYESAEWCRRSGADRWVKRVWLHLRDPWHCHNVFAQPGWIRRFKGRHPPEIQQLRKRLEKDPSHPLRPQDDIFRWLYNPGYVAFGHLLGLCARFPTWFTPDPFRAAFGKLRRRLFGFHR